MTPTLLLTRPDGRNASFAAEVRARWQGALSVISSPLLRIEFLTVSPPQADALIFTSVNGVAAASASGLSDRRLAWCVGEQTAEAARAAGFATKTGPGDASGLIAQIIAAQPQGNLAHFRGKHARGDVAGSLTDAGLRCADVIAYDQVACDMTAQALAALNASSPVVAPLFSPRTAKLFAQQGPFAAPLHVVAMSDAVRAELETMPMAGLVTAAAPDADHMADAVASVLASL